MQTVSRLARRIYRLILASWMGQGRAIAVFLGAIFLSAGFLVPSAIAADLAIAPDADLARGATVFEATCAGCHVNGGNIIRRGKTLKAKALQRNQADSVEAVSAIIRNGKGIMSAYGDRLSAVEIRDLASYVLDRANADWP